MWKISWQYVNTTQVKFWKMLSLQFMLVLFKDNLIYDHKYVCEPHAEYSNPFGMNTKLECVKHTVSFVNA